MNIRFLKTSACLCGLLALAWSAAAQSPVARVRVPFSFMAGGILLPAGEYSIDKQEASGVLLIHGGPGRAVAVLTVPVTVSPQATETKLHFDRHGGNFYLTGIQFADAPARQVLPAR